MFYQARVLPKDTDALRFLWWPNSIDSPPKEYQMLVHIFGAKSSPCCASMALKATADDNQERYSPDVTEVVRRNFYVDDVLKSTTRIDEAIRISTELSSLLKEGGFRLTKFTSNSREILASMPVEDRANPELDLDLDRLPVERTLGIHWDSQSDKLQFMFKPKSRSRNEASFRPSVPCLTLWGSCHPSYCRSSSFYKICGERSFPGMNRSLNLTDHYGVNGYSHCLAS